MQPAQALAPELRGAPQDRQPAVIQGRSSRHPGQRPLSATGPLQNWQRP